MLDQLTNVLRIRELRNRLLITIGLLLIFRVGSYIPVPGVDIGVLEQRLDVGIEEGGGVAGQAMLMLRLVSGGQGFPAVFALGIMPYISASIIFSLLTNVVPRLEELQKQGEAGRRKIRQYERYATMALCIVQSVMMLGLWRNQAQGMLSPDPMFAILSTVIVTTGTLFLLWLGNQISEFGIGNGISLLIMAGIVARMPLALYDMFSGGDGGASLVSGSLLVMMFVAIIGGVVLIQLATRRIPTLQPKFTRGRRVYGGQSRHIPLRVNMAGVMPVIFASAILTFLTTPIMIIGDKLANDPSNSQRAGLGWETFRFMQNGQIFEYGDLGYMVLFAMMIFFFGFFWTSLQFKPQEMAENLKEYGSVIPGIPQGKKTAQFLEKTMINITIAGSTFLVIIALLPMVVSKSPNVNPMVAGMYGGTGLLIVVSVALDLVNRIQDQLVMRSYQGFMRRSTVR